MSQGAPLDKTQGSAGLISRDREMAVLLKAIDMALVQKGGMVFIRGEAGIGKSRLVNEVSSIARKKGFHILRASCMEYRRAPYQPFREMLVELFGVDLKQGHPENMARIHDKFSREIPALGEEKDILMDFFYPQDEPVGGYIIQVSELYRSIKYLRRKGYRVIYIGDQSRLASRMIHEDGIEVVGMGSGPKDRLDPRRLQRIAKYIQDCLRSFNHSAIILGDMDTLISANGEERVSDLMGICSSISRENGGLVAFVLVPNISGIGQGSRTLSDFFDAEEGSRSDDAGVQKDQRPSISIIEVLSKLFREMGKTAPQLTIVEDLHWGDKATFNLLQYLARNIVDQGHLMIGTFRDENLLEEEGNNPSHLAEALKRFTREHLFEELCLKRMDRKATLSMLLELTGERPGEDFLDEVMLQTDGNPLFVTELLKVRSDSSGPHPPMMEVTPRSAISLVERRLASLEAEDRRVLEMASILDKQASIEILGRALDLELDVLLDIMDRLISLRFFKEGDDHINFEHSKVRESIYDLIGERERDAMHLSCARVLEDQIPRDSPLFASVLSYHYIRGGEPMRALEYLMKIAEGPNVAMSREELLENMSTALKTLDLKGREDITVEFRVRALMRIGDIEESLEMLSEAIITYQEALNYSEAMDLDAHIVTCNRRLGDLTLKFYKWDLSIDHYMKALHLAQKGEDSLERSMCFMGLGRMYYLKGDYKRAIECHLLHIENPMRSIGRQHLDGIMNLGSIYLEMGDFNQALVYFRLGIRTAEENDVQEAMPIAYMNMAKVLVKLDEYAEAENFAEMSLSLARDMNLPQLRNRISVNYAELMLEIGNVKEATAVLNPEGGEWKFDDGLIEAIYHRVSGSLYSKIRDPDRATESMMRSVEIAESLQVRYELARSLFEFGLLRFQALDMAGAIESVTRANQIFKEVRSLYYHNRTSSKLREMKFINEGMKNI
ncbi:MAG: AAA family ATPase [Candidatus Thermoplasmatota archaeon]|nr:AAA family ATPase [Candidatus Thermoplasmatota archaeon]